MLLSSRSLRLRSRLVTSTVCAFFLLLSVTGLARESRGSSNPAPKPANSEQDLAQSYSLDNREGRTSTVSDPWLLGSWKCETANGSIYLEVVSESRMIFSGRPVVYRLQPGVIEVQDEEGWTTYHYTITDSLLILVLSDSSGDGGKLSFARIIEPGDTIDVSPSAEED